MEFVITFVLMLLPLVIALAIVAYFVVAVRRIADTLDRMRLDLARIVRAVEERPLSGRHE